MILWIEKNNPMSSCLSAPGVYKMNFQSKMCVVKPRTVGWNKNSGVRKLNRMVNNKNVFRVL